MKKEKYIRFIYNGGKVTDVKHKHYLQNIGYWIGEPVIQKTIYKWCFSNELKYVFILFGIKYIWC